MFSIGGWELAIVFAIALMVLGPDKIPPLARYVAKTMRQFREAASEVRRNLQIDEFENTRREIRDTWRSTRQVKENVWKTSPQTSPPAGEPPDQNAARQDTENKASEENTHTHEKKNDTPAAESPESPAEQTPIDPAEEEDFYQD